MITELYINMKIFILIRQTCRLKKKDVKIGFFKRPIRE